MNINKLIKKRLSLLENSNNTLKDIFNIIHEEDSYIFCESTNGYKIKKTTYGECKKYCIKMANYLNKTLANTKKHSFVGLMMENSLEFITTFFGLLMAGYKPVLLNIRLGRNLNSEIINKLKITNVICDNDYDLDVNLINVKNINYDEINDDFDNFKWEDEIAISTSATSLNVKICIYDGASICEQIRNTNKLLKDNPMMKKQYNGSIKQLTFLPFYHIFGLMATYFWFSFFGQTFVFLKDFSSDTILRTVQKHKVTHIFSVPMLWHTIYKSLMKEISLRDEKTQKKFYKGIELSNKLQSICPKFGRFVAKHMFKEIHDKLFGDSISFMISGGSYISKDAIETINGIGYPLFNGYGMSEIGITSVELSKKANIRNLTSIGKPFSKVEYKINAAGQLLVKSKGMCKRIITKDTDVMINHNEYFNTFDLATVDKKNRYYIMGRTDDVVLTEDGEKINPDIIEKNLRFQHVDRFVILGLENGDKHTLSLILEIDKNANQLKINAILEEVNKNLKKLNDNNYHIDKVLYTYNAISSPQAIKVSRKILKKWIAEEIVKLYSLSELKEKTIEDLSELEVKLCSEIKNIFGEVLNIDINTIDIKSHFILDLGGTSLEYLTLLVKLEEFYDMKFNLNNECCYSVLEFADYLIKCIK